MHQELVERRRWISENASLHALNYCMLLPARRRSNWPPSAGCCTHAAASLPAGCSCPSLFILITLSWIYLAFGDMPLVAGLFYGIKPAVTAIVVQATQRIGARALKNRLMWAIAAASFVAIFWPRPALPAHRRHGGAGRLSAGGSRSSFMPGGGHGSAVQSFGRA